MKSKTKVALLTTLLAALVPPVGIALTLSLMPSVVTRKVSVGGFISARVNPGWGMVTVETTRGTLVVVRRFNALRGTPLVLIDSTKGGIQLCGKDGMATCVDLVGHYVGDLPPVPHAHVWLSHEQRATLGRLALWWGLFGIAGFELVAIRAAAEEDDDRGGDGGANPPKGVKKLT